MNLIGQAYVLKEIKILKFMPSCPYLIQLFEVYESSEDIIMLFEYMPGADLYKRIKRDNKISENDSFCYFSQLLKGILFLHQNGICHRDIKPDNILCSLKKRNSKSQILVLLITFLLWKEYAVLLVIWLQRYSIRKNTMRKLMCLV